MKQQPSRISIDGQKQETHIYEYETLGQKIESLNPDFLNHKISGFRGDQSRLLFEIDHKDQSYSVECQIYKHQGLDTYKFFVIIRDMKTQIIKKLYQGVCHDGELVTLNMVCFYLNENFD